VSVDTLGFLLTIRGFHPSNNSIIQAAIDLFVPADSIEWIWYDKPHYLTPDDPVGEEAFSVILDAMESTGMVGVSRLVLYRRERAAMLERRDKGILWTLRR
jgi:DNA end-binding protein Ku